MWVWNNEVEKTFGLYEDMIALGIRYKNGVLNRETLEKIDRITSEVVRLKGVASRDVSSFTTIDNVTIEAETLNVRPLMSVPPKTDEEVGALRKALFDNRMFINRIISKDEKTTAIFIPLGARTVS